MANRVQFRILGPLEARLAGRRVALGGPRQRTVLGLLLLYPNEVVESDRLVDALWHRGAPRTASASLQNQVARLRRVLGAQRIAFVAPGYMVRVRADELDALRFERLLERAAGREPKARAAVLRQALALWRGRPLADLQPDDFAKREVARLEELRLDALEERIEAELELEGDGTLVAELHALVAEHPLRERFLEQLMVALYRAGRQADALAAYRVARRRLLDELGLDPSETLKRLERAILVHESALSPRARQDVPLTLLQRAIELAPADYETRADFAYRLGIGLSRLGEREHARDALEEARDLARRIGARAIEVRAELELAVSEYYGDQPNVRAHRRLVDKAVTEFALLEDELGLALALFARANALRDAGNVRDALRDYESAAESARRAVGDSWPTGLILAIEGWTLSIGPTPVSEAIRRCDEILHAVEWGPPGPFGVYSALGVLYAMAGDASAGRTFSARAIAACEEYGLAPVLEGTIRPDAATVEELAGDSARALELLRLSYKRVEEQKFVPGIGVVAPRLARLLAARGQTAEALKLADRARTVAARDDVLARAEWLRARARALVGESGGRGEAIRSAERALRILRATDLLPLRAAAELDLAHVLLAAGRTRAAAGAAARAAALNEQKGNLVAAREAREFPGFSESS